jgi:phosphoglycolate phosphatase-like HAD superfamily hydrolase
MIRAIILDFDLTLIDRSVSEPYRKTRNWKKVFDLIPQFTLYDGLNEVFSYIRENDIQVVIVSFASSKLIEETAKYFNIPYNFIIAGNQIKNKKPHPESMLKALELLKVEANDIISFGDNLIDYEASKSANIKFIACLWGSQDKENLENSDCENFADNPLNIIDILTSLNQ